MPFSVQLFLLDGLWHTRAATHSDTSKARSLIDQRLKSQRSFRKPPCPFSPKQVDSSPGFEWILDQPVQKSPVLSKPLLLSQAQHILVKDICEPKVEVDNSQHQSRVANYGDQIKVNAVFKARIIYFRYFHDHDAVELVAMHASCLPLYNKMRRLMR
uniref:Uncharacterized protein n=1 Tax=Ditylenchus dipsaci TaxID=166011 RepID=A0A915DD55_9BILA